MSRLVEIARDLVARAIATGDDQVLTLERGARLAVRAADGWAAVRISRPGAPLGSLEEVIFMQSFGMPLDALRSPALPEQHTIERDGSTWYSIVLRYELDRAVLPAAGLDQVEPLQPQLFDMEGIDNATQTNHAAAGVAGRQ